MGQNQIVSGGTALFAGVFAGVAVVALVILVFIIVVVANRAEPDPRGLRPYSVYLFGMSFVTLLLTYAGVTMIVTSLLSFIGSHDSPIADSVASSVVIGGILVLIAGGALHYHLRKGLEIARGDGTADGPNARVLHTYVSVVTFIFFATMLITLGVAIYLVFQLIGPGIFGAGAGRTATLRTLLDVVYVMGASGFIILAHSRLAPTALRLGALGAPSGAGSHQ
ncbi:MAG TPA: hypothetical protein VGL48_15810 [Acidimicrobiales bacterium]|jgi:hypothetical protein